MTTDQALPGAKELLEGSDAPSLMVWNQEISRWVTLDVASVKDTAVGTAGLRAFTVTLNQPPALYDANGNARALQVGDRISPATERAPAIALQLEAYFDSLGPGEIVDTNAVSFARAARQPRPAQDYPMRAGQVLITGLPIGTAEAQLTIMTRNDPDLPTNPVDGPNLITLGAVNIFPL